MTVEEQQPTVEHGPRIRRWVFGLSVVVVLVIAGGLGARYVWLPGYRPALPAGERFGVDVSNHQGEIDWAKVAADDVTFAYVNATEGGDFVDQHLARNWEGAGATGLERGAYHFFTLCRSGTEQADNFLRILPRDPGSLPPVVDLELGGNCADRPDQAWVQREVGAFLTKVEAATDRTVVVYLLDDFEEEFRLRATLDRPRWERRILLRPERDDWWIWQVHSQAAVDGIDGGADLNVMRPDR